MNSTPAYDSIALNDLQARTQYEAWLLEAVYDVAGLPVIADFPDQLVYPASGAVVIFRSQLHQLTRLGDRCAVDF